MIESIFCNTQGKAILNVRNGATLPFLLAETFVEVPCAVAGDRVVSSPVAAVPDHCRVLMRSSAGAGTLQELLKAGRNLNLSTP